MAYENYNFISWTDGTPLSSARLAQMSTNIEQVRDVIDVKPFGMLSFNQSTAQIVYANTNFTENEVIFLQDDTGTGGSDKRVNILENRYYKVTVNVPTISVLNAGCEDSKYVINIYNGLNLLDNGRSKIGSWEFTPHTFSFINVANGSANISNEAIKSNVYLSKMAGGTYSVVGVSNVGTPLNNQTFFLTVSRSAGANTNNAPAWRIEGSASSPVQIYVEDVGGA